jgi:hypothetical protein
MAGCQVAEGYVEGPAVKVTWACGIVGQLREGKRRTGLLCLRCSTYEVTPSMHCSRPASGENLINRVGRGAVGTARRGADVGAMWRRLDVAPVGSR